MRSNYSASDFLDPDKFRTQFDVDAKRARKRYLDGCVECDDYTEIFIAVNDTVSATLKVGNGSMNGYERLGYHCYSSEYLRAILHSGCPVWVYRIGSDGRIENINCVKESDSMYGASYDTELYCADCAEVIKQRIRAEGNAPPMRTISTVMTSMSSRRIVTFRVNPILLSIVRPARIVSMLSSLRMVSGLAVGWKMT